ncbi:MAG TPA: cupin domain-containing protein [Puia sp.]|nr:cupin domain-containing protein [Puia sp.]
MLTPTEKTMLTATEIRQRFNLQPNPAEGGFFAGTYTSTVQLPVSDLPGFSPASKTRPLCGAIFYFLDTSTFSALHRVTGDMIYHFYSGHAVEMLLLHPDGTAGTCIFGNDLAKNQIPMKVIPGGTWLGSRIKPGSGATPPPGSHPPPAVAYALMGVTMAPGFDPVDYTIAKREDLLREYSDKKIKDLIIALTRS